MKISSLFLPPVSKHHSRLRLFAIWFTLDVGRQVLKLVHLQYLSSSLIHLSPSHLHTWILSLLFSFFFSPEHTSTSSDYLPPAHYSYLQMLSPNIIIDHGDFCLISSAKQTTKQEHSELIPDVSPLRTAVISIHIFLSVSLCKSF